MERMAEDRLTKRDDAYGEEGRRRRGRPRLRWEDCVKRDVRKAGVERKLEGKAHDRGEWRPMVRNATYKLNKGTRSGEGDDIGIHQYLVCRIVHIRLFNNYVSYRHQHQRKSITYSLR